MVTAVLHGIRDVRLENREIPQPKENEVLVKIARVGICGSDLHYYTDLHIGRFVVEAPLILGHESAGVIAAVGSGVQNLKIGDRVSLEPGVTCGTCYHCKRGRYNLCPDVIFMATPPVDGAFAEYLTWRSDFVFKIPDHVSLDAAALLEPLSVAVWAVQRAGIGMGASIAIFGGGTIGCMTVQAAKAAGATTIIVIDLEPFRLEFAKEFGATHTINASSSVLEQIRAITMPLNGLTGSSAGVDAAFETAGALVTCRQTIEAVRSGGVAVLVGLPPDPLVSLDIVAAASREVDIRGQFRYANCYPAALALVSSGRVNLEKMITQRYSLQDTQAALEFADTEKKKSLKVMIEI